MTEKREMSSIPSQKSGIETPNWLVRRTITSLTRPSRSAEYTPAGTEMSSAITRPTTASEIVAGNRCSSVVVTGCPLRKLTPRSPVTAWAM
ncbi:hypothetical protein SRABI128_03628 [Microbacterium sp. Bi128]|nr:hypothetical protein SRABI128_03628 [Microbacterium sp. Bi128]